MKTHPLFFLFALILCLGSCKDDEPIENFFVNTTWKRALDTSGSRYEVLKFYSGGRLHIPADTRSAFPVISVQSPVSIQCCWQS